LVTSAVGFRNSRRHQCAGQPCDRSQPLGVGAGAELLGAELLGALGMLGVLGTLGWLLGGSR
jgi:hypothetical protein